MSLHPLGIKKLGKIFLVLLVALAFFDMFRVRYLIIIKSGPIVRASQPYEQRGILGGPRVLILGDSTAVGTGASHSAKSVAGLLGADFPDARIENRARNGMRAWELNRMFRAQPGAYDLIIIQIGGNDELRFTPLSLLRDDISAILAKAKRTAPNVVFLTTGNIGLAPFFPWWAGWIWTERTRDAREVFIAEAKKQGVSYVDLFTEKADDPFSENPEQFYAPDYLHLSDNGYALWYQKIRETMEREGIIPVGQPHSIRCDAPQLGGAFCMPQ